MLVNRLTTALSPDGVPNDDAVISAVYTAWVLFFFIGIGAFNGIFKWAFSRREPTYAEELQLAGKDQGLWRYFRYTTDHKVVGMQYLATVFVLFFLGSMGAFSIRLEQSTPGAIYFNPSTYNTIVGMHGILMIASTIIMVSGPFGNFILPIMIGARDMAFPRLNALSYWLLFTAIPIFLSALLLGGFQTGWTGYAPLADQGLTPGMDAYCFTILVFAISTTIAAVNILTTVIVMRTRVMTWRVGFMTLGNMMGIAGCPGLVAAYGGDRAAYGLMGWTDLLKYQSGLIFTPGGSVFDPETLVVRGTLPASVITEPDVAAGRVFREGDTADGPVR